MGRQCFQGSRRRFLKNSASILGGVGLISLFGKQEAHALTVQQGQLILANARSMIGVPYKYGSTDLPRSTDCSALTRAAYASARISIRRTAAEQYLDCRYSANVPGALVFFRGTDPNRPASMITHVGINVGNGRMVNANSYNGKVVEEQWQGNSYWMRYFAGCGTL